jgi:hypothetical protein
MERVFAFNTSNDEIVSFVAHPYLDQLDKVSYDQQPLHEFLGVYIEQYYNIKEVLIEFLFRTDDKQLYLNKVFTTNGLKFHHKFIATNNFYGLKSGDTLYLLPARSPNRVFTIGTKTLMDKEPSVVDVIGSFSGYAYVDRQRNTKVFIPKEREERVYL